MSYTNYSIPEGLSRYLSVNTLV